MKRPCWRRSSGTSAMPAFIAALGEPALSSRPLTVIEPESYRSTPKIARATSDRPEPTRPARATISPARTLNEMFSNWPSRARFSTSRTTSPIVASSLGKSSDTSRPTIARITCGSSKAEVSAVLTVEPSRIMVIRSQRAKTSSRRWLTNTTAQPFSLRLRATAKRRSTSFEERAAVGSSMTITFALVDIAFAISTICWSAIERPRARLNGFNETPS